MDAAGLTPEERKGAVELFRAKVEAVAGHKLKILEFRQTIPDGADEPGGREGFSDKRRVEKCLRHRACVTGSCDMACDSGGVVAGRAGEAASQGQK